MKIELKAGSLSSWFWHELQAMSLPVVCLDARHAKAALAAHVNKTDKNDALGLAQIVRTGWYREVRVKSFASHALRGLLTSRAQLVRTRLDLANQIRGVLKPFGVIVGPVSFADITSWDRASPMVAARVSPIGPANAVPCCRACDR